MTTKITIYLCLLLLTLTITNVKSQNCAASSGNTNTGYDFSRGPSARGDAIPDKTNYGYSNVDVPDDGQYAIVKTTAGMSHVNSGAWLEVINHTPNDPDGYMMLINADEFEAGMFYQETISGLCPGTTYDFGAWIINVMARPGIRPNVKFIIETTDGDPIKEFSTDPIPEGSRTDWKRYSTTFTSDANSTEVVIKILNNGLGGGGNDFALDDITFTACGPEIIPSINGEEGTYFKNLCIGHTENFTLFAEATEGVYVNPQYLWQKMDDNGDWQDMSGETSPTYTVEFNDAKVGSYKYQLLVAENGNINSVNCRVTSPTFEFHVSPLPDPQVANPSITICEGESIHLSVSNFSKYEWTGPLGFSSSVRSPIIDNATLNMTGTYHVTVTNDAGCVASTQIEVTVVPRPIAVIDPVPVICKGESITLNASGGLTYRWEPSSTLSGIDSANPEVSPTETTVYNVYVSNEYCESKIPASITVVVREELKAMAGSDFSILKGNSIRLDGSATGDDIAQIFWTPADHLDNPTILNPIYSPPKNGTYTYTLNIISAFGCTSSSDEVTIKVYEKIVVPNSFSPNGDSINDTWNIIGIDTYSNPTVKVMNRYGQLMFEGKGDKTSWDGKWRNEDVPVGVYYYIVNLEAGVKPLSGSLMVIR